MSNMLDAAGNEVGDFFDNLIPGIPGELVGGLLGGIPKGLGSVLDLFSRIFNSGGSVGGTPPSSGGIDLGGLLGGLTGGLGGLPDIGTNPNLNNLGVLFGQVLNSGSSGEFPKTVPTGGGFPKPGDTDTDINVGGTTATGGEGGAGGAGGTGGSVGDIINNINPGNLNIPDILTLFTSLLNIFKDEELSSPKPATAIDAFIENFVSRNADQFFNRLQDLAFTEQEFSPLEQRLIDDILGNTGLADNLQDDQGLLRSLFPVIEEGARTGLPQDTRALFAEFANSLAPELFGQAAERAPGGVGSSGFLAESGNIARQLAGQGAAAQIAANEAAKGRQLEFLGGALPFVGGTNALPLSFLNDIFSLGGTQRGQDLAMRGIPLDVFSSLAGRNNRLFQPGFTGQNDLADLLGSLNDIFGPSPGPSQDQQTQRSFFPR